MPCPRWGARCNWRGGNTASPVALAKGSTPWTPQPLPPVASDHILNSMSSTVASIDHSKRARRRGPAPGDPAELRVHLVSVRLSSAELVQLDATRRLVRMQRGEFLRAAALHKLPPTIPSLNREAWTELSRAASSLQQIARRVNLASAGAPEMAPKLSEAAAVLADFRRALLGAEAME